MLRLPKNVSPELRAALEQSLSSPALEASLDRIAELMLSLFGAEDVALNFVRFGQNREVRESMFVVKTMREAVSESYHARFAAIWNDSGVRDEAAQNVEARLSAVSYSAFAWPHAIVSNEDNPTLSLPRDYTIFIPFSSSLIVTQKREDEFSAYAAVMYDHFPEIGDNIVGHIMSLPTLLSESMAAYLRERELYTAEKPPSGLQEVMQ